MLKTPRIPLWFAILINVNIMLGSGIFINTVNLAKIAGLLSAFGYFLVGVLMLPIVLTIATLVSRYPVGGFFEYARAGLGTSWGFISAWTYFIGKLASATVMIHISMMLLQTLFTQLATVPTLVLDLITLSTFTILNMLNFRTSSVIQTGFMVLKMIPVLFVIIGGLWALFGALEPQPFVYWSGFLCTLPIVMYALLGFEAACSISDKIENPEVNGPRAIMYSFGLVALILTLFQFFVVLFIGKQIVFFADFRETFPTFARLILLFSGTTISRIIALLHAAIAASALGGSYGILFSNNWNLYILAQHNLVPVPHLFSRLNRASIPWLCVLSEGAVCLVYLMSMYLFGTQIVQLQQIGALASSISYGLSTISFIVLWQHAIHSRQLYIAFLSVGSCLLLISLTIYNFVTTGIGILLLFFGLILGGVIVSRYHAKSLK